MKKPTPTGEKMSGVVARLRKACGTDDGRDKPACSPAQEARTAFAERCSKIKLRSVFPPKAIPSKDHRVFNFRTQRIECLNCGATDNPLLGTTREIGAQVDAFTAQHADCKPKYKEQV